MPKVKNVEKRIWDKEGFDVRITKDGKDARGDKNISTSWPYEKQSKNSMTVKEFRDKFEEVFPGYSVDVLDDNGEAVIGNTLLGNVRDTYNDDRQNNENRHQFHLSSKSN